MENFKLVIMILATLSLGFSMAEIYFAANQLWPRKHDRTVVESLSLTALLIGMIPLTLSAIDCALHAQWRVMTEALLFVAWGAARVIVALGIWLPDGARLTVWQRMKRVFRRERETAGDLARALFRPSQASLVLEILSRVAWLDDELHANEAQLIADFARAWHVPFDVDEARGSGRRTSAGRLVELGQKVSAYLDTMPPREQAAHLSDVIRQLVEVDENVSTDEDIALSELQGMLHAYCNRQEGLAECFAVLVPRGLAEADAIRLNLPSLEQRVLPSGEVFVAGPFYSQRFAGKVAEQHRALGFFSVAVNDDLLADARQVASA